MYYLILRSRKTQSELCAEAISIPLVHNEQKKLPIQSPASAMFPGCDVIDVWHDAQ